MDRVKGVEGLRRVGGQLLVEVDWIALLLLLLLARSTLRVARAVGEAALLCWWGLDAGSFVG